MASASIEAGSSLPEVSQQDLHEIVSLTAPRVWESLRGQRVFITGGTGFVGKWLLEALVHVNATLSLGVSVSVLSRRPQRLKEACPWLAFAPGVSWVTGDIAENNWQAPAFDLAIHAALPVAQTGVEDASLVELARQGAQKIAEQAQACGARRVLHISSGAVYAGLDTATPDESMAWDDALQVNAYTRAKRSAEAVFRQNWPFETVIARCFSFLGPYLEAGSGTAGAVFAESARTNSPIDIQSDGMPVRGYQYASDMVRWLLTILTQGTPGEAYNVGHEQAVSILALAQAFSDASTPVLPVHVHARHVTGLAGARYLPNVSKARDNLGLANHVGLEEGVRRTLLWQMNRLADRSL